MLGTRDQHLKDVHLKPEGISFPLHMHPVIQKAGSCAVSCYVSCSISGLQVRWLYCQLLSQLLRQLRNGQSESLLAVLLAADPAVMYAWSSQVC